jgi:hypothetical protein
VAARNWKSNVPISMPQPVDPNVPVLVDMGGFGFTANGLCHNITSTEVEDVLSPLLLPEPIED